MCPPSGGGSNDNNNNNDLCNAFGGTVDSMSNCVDLPTTFEPS